MSDLRRGQTIGAAGATARGAVAANETQEKERTVQMTTEYGSIKGYGPDANGKYVASLSYQLTAGTTYDIQVSADGGATWVSVGTFLLPAGTFASLAANFPGSLAQAGYPLRYVSK